jgi:hypothetical protein
MYNFFRVVSPEICVMDGKAKLSFNKTRICKLLEWTTVKS